MINIREPKLPDKVYIIAFFLASVVVGFILRGQVDSINEKSIDVPVQYPTELNQERLETKKLSEPVENNQGDLSFDIDVTNLSYELPSYTKICIPDTKYYCTPSDGCKQTKAEVFLLYNEIDKLIYRCDNKPCDEFLVESDQSGIYENIEPVLPRGFSVKISKDNEYLENVSLGLGSYLSYGKCSKSIR